MADSAPYWCTVVPRAALWQVTGIPPEQLREADDRKAVPGVEITCHGNLDGVEILAIIVASGRLAQDQEYRQQASTADQGLETLLPADLGLAHLRQTGTSGWLAHALFRCGTTPYWLDLYIGQIAPGRDPRADASGLLRIGEQRLAALNHCRLDTAGPPPKPLPASGQP